MNNGLFGHSDFDNPRRVSKLKNLIEEIDSLAKQRTWSSSYYEWDNRVKRSLKSDFGSDALNLFTKQRSVDLSNEGYQHELEQRRHLLERILEHKDEYVPNTGSDGYTNPGSGTEYPTNRGPVVISHSQVNFGRANMAQGGSMTVSNVGDIFSTAEAKLKDLPLWAKWITVIVAVLAILWAVFTYLFPSPGNFIKAKLVSSVSSGSISTTTPDIGEIISKANAYSTSLEEENFISNYSDTEVHGSGTFENIGSSGGNPGNGYIVTITVGGDEVSCMFDQTYKDKLLLMNKGQTLNFYGLFKASRVFEGGWYITDCGLINGQKLNRVEP